MLKLVALATVVVVVLGRWSAEAWVRADAVRVPSVAGWRSQAGPRRLAAAQGGEEPEPAPAPKRKRGRPKGSRSTTAPTERKKRQTEAGRVRAEENRQLRRPVVVMLMGGTQVEADTEFFNQVRERCQADLGEDVEFMLREITEEEEARVREEAANTPVKANDRLRADSGGLLDPDEEDELMFQYVEQAPDREMMQMWMESRVAVTPLAARRKNKPLEYTSDLLDQVTATIKFYMEPERILSHPRRADDNKGLL